jgi:hypothetical protein
MELIAASEAYSNTKKNLSSKWKGRSDETRKSRIFLPEITPSFKIKRGSSVFTIGSCFARHIEKSLKNNGFSVPAFEYRVPESELQGNTKMQAGFLNKYTTQSMLNEVDFAFGNSDGQEYLVETSSGFIDSQCHTDKPVPLERALERRAEIRELYSSAIRNSELVIITLGLIEAWWDEKNQVYLNETPSPIIVKSNKNRFFFQRLSVEKNIECVNKLIEKIKSEGREDQKILITVSPIPIQRTFTQDDVVTANTYSKSVLRVAAQQAVERFESIDYYPSYESISNTTPDVSWEDDLIHVRQEAVNENVERMLRSYVVD